jgi:hypothetical protein
MNTLAKTFFITLFILSEINACRAQDINKWDAQWISHPGVQPQEAAVILFRKNIPLVAKPSTYIIHISADNHYRLFVNGNYVTRGPGTWRFIALVL